MNNDKMIQFVKRWRDIEQAQKDLDFKRSVLSRDIRAEFGNGEAGDEQFVNWCITELGVTAFGARELLTRAIAASVVPDERTWKMVGGFRAIRPLQDLPRKEQVNVLEAAKTSARAPINIMRERGLLKPVETPAAHRAPAPAPIVVTRREPANVNANQAQLDAIVLAQYIAKNCKGIPRDVLAVINRYQSFMRKAG